MRAIVARERAAALREAASDWLTTGASGAGVYPWLTARANAEETA